MAFPSISTPVTATIEEESNAIKAEFEGGYELKRELSTRYRRKITANYILTEAEKNDLLAHYKSVRESVSFNWTDPKTSEVMTVRYDAPIKIPYDGKWCFNYKVTIKLREL